VPKTLSFTIQGLKVDKKRLKQITTAQMQTIYELKGIVVDSIYIDNFIIDTLHCITIADKWFCDKIYSMNRMCEVGSIGTYAQFVNDSEALKKWGYIIEEIYPPESKYKNLPEREAIDGKPDRIIKEQLTPFAIHFQNIIKENRPKLNQSTEGILEGKVFYAYDAVENGLIDGLMNLEQAIKKVQDLTKIQQSIYSSFK